MTTLHDEGQPPGFSTPNLAAELTYAEWCVVVAHLASGVYRDVMPIMDKLLTQLGPQADAQQQQAMLAVTPAPSDSRN